MEADTRHQQSPSSLIHQHQPNKTQSFHPRRLRTLTAELLCLNVPTGTRAAAAGKAPSGAQAEAQPAARRAALSAAPPDGARAAPSARAAPRSPHARTAPAPRFLSQAARSGRRTRRTRSSTPRAYPPGSRAEVEEQRPVLLHRAEAAALRQRRDSPTARRGAFGGGGGARAVRARRP